MKIWLFQMFEFYKRVPGASTNPENVKKIYPEKKKIW